MFWTLLDKDDGPKYVSVCPTQFQKKNILKILWFIYLNENAFIIVIIYLAFIIRCYWTPTYIDSYKRQKIELSYLSEKLSKRGSSVQWNPCIKSLMNSFQLFW